MVTLDDEDGWLDFFLPPEPFRSGNLTPEQADDWQMLTGWDSQQPFYTPNGIDRHDARRMLGQLPESALSHRWNFSPTVGAILRSIVKHPHVRANEAAPDGVPDSHGAISGVLIDDPELLTFTPDVALGPVPPWVADQEPELRREYYHHRAGCMAQSVYRQRWYAARHRYDLRDAVRGPDEIDVVTGPRGTRVLHFWWD